MKRRTGAGRVARMLFEACGADGCARMDQDLTTLAGLIREHPSLLRVLQDRHVPDARKQGLLTRLGAAAGLSAEAVRFVAFLAARRQLSLLSDLAVAFHARVMELQQRVRAEVTTATPLSSEQIEALSRALSASTAKTVSVEARIDPDLLGGAVTRVGSLVIDGSVAGQLERMRRQLVQR